MLQILPTEVYSSIYTWIKLEGQERFQSGSRIIDCKKGGAKNSRGMISGTPSHSVLFHVVVVQQKPTQHW